MMPDQTKFLPVVKVDTIKHGTGYGFKITVKDHEGHLIRTITQTKVTYMFKKEAAEMGTYMAIKYQEFYVKSLSKKKREKNGEALLLQ